VPDGGRPSLRFENIAAARCSAAPEVAGSASIALMNSARDAAERAVTRAPGDAGTATIEISRSVVFLNRIPPRGLALSIGSAAVGSISNPIYNPFRTPAFSKARV
jgi:hypothetical protein